MALPDPEPGLVVRYDYLWSREQAAGRDQGKDRPACLVMVSDDVTRGRFVVLLPITHSAPTGDTVGIEIPQAVKQAIGLDAVPSWVVVSDFNVDSWPSGGLSSLPGLPDVFAYGFVPPGLFAKIKAAFLEIARAGKGKSVRR